jgi:hypothetical protein
MFTILHAHVLPQDNYLPRNHHAVKSLTKKLGLAYNTIHACEKGCVLFRGAFADAEKCPKCDQPRYKDIDRKKFPVKVLRHFPIIPRLQRMFRSPAISKLMLWHSETAAVERVVTISSDIPATQRPGITFTAMSIQHLVAIREMCT